MFAPPSISSIVLAGIWDYNFGNAQEGSDHQKDSVVSFVSSRAELIFLSHFVILFTQSSVNLWLDVKDWK